MIIKNLIKQLIKHGENISEDQDIYIRCGDNAYPAQVRFFKENGKTVPYIDIDYSKLDSHKNYPPNSDEI